MNDACSFLRKTFSRIILVPLTVLLFNCTHLSEAAVLTWTGNAAGGNRNWNAGNNWDTLTVPQNNDSLVFPASVGGSITNNLSNRTIGQISFNGVGGSYFVYGNAITLTGGIVQSSSGGANTWHPDITLATNNQTFSVTGSGVGSGLTIDGDINLNGQNLTVNVTDSGTELDLGGAVSGTGNITRGTGLGGLRFFGSAANTYIGTTTINSGYIYTIKSSGVISIPGDVIIGNGSATDTLLMGTDNQIASTADISIRTGGVFDMNGQSNTVASVTFIDGGTVQTAAGGELRLGGPVTLNGAGTAASITGNLHVGTASRTITVTNTASTLTISAVVKGGNSGSPFFIPAGFTKSGPGLLILSGANTYGGPATINDGTLRVDNKLALGASGAASLFNNPTTIVNSNGVLLLENAHITNEVLTLNSTNPSGALQVNATGDWIGDITLSTDVVIEASSLLQLGGVISGPGGFTKISPDTLRMIGTDANTYAGTTIVQNGTLELNRNVFDGCIPGDLIIGGGNSTTKTVRNLAFINQIANTANVVIETNGVLDLNGFLDGIGSLDMTGGSVTTGAGYLELIGAGGGITTHSSSFQASISGTFDLGTQVRTFDIASGIASPELLISAVIRNGGAIKTGIGNLRLAGANTYSGLTTISNGFIEVNNATALGSTAAGTVLTGTSSHLLINGVTVVGEALTNNSSSSDFRSSGPSGWSGNIVLNAQLDVLPFGTTFDLSGVISGTGAVTKSQTGTLIYSGGSANTYTGTTTVSQGTLQLSKSVANAIVGNLIIGDGVGGVNADVLQLTTDNQIADTSTVTINSSGLLDLNNQTDTMGSISGNGGIDLGGGTLREGNDGGSSTFSGLMAGAGILFKFGLGTWTLTGNNTYTASTTVSGGTLLVNGSQPQSPITVNGTATLGGSGTVGNIFAFGSIAPGNSPGMLTCSNVAFFNSAAEYFVELTGLTAGTDNDQLNARGTNALASAALHVTPAFTTPVGVGQKFTIINNDAADAITGTFNGLAEGAPVVSGGYGFRISYVGGTGNDVVLTLTNVPSATVTSTITTGNGNHFIDPNDCNHLSLVISNQSGATMSGITATLSTTTPDVLITQPYSSYPNLAINGKGTNTTPFQISTLSGFICGTDIQLQLIVNSSAGSFIIDSVLKTGSSLPSASPLRYDISVATNLLDPGTIESTNNVTGFVGPLNKVTVALWLTHTIDSDLSISLISPDGVIVDLSSGNGGSGDDFGTSCSPDSSRTTFDDSAATSITAGIAPFVGTFKPEGSLASVLGGTINGAWRLRVTDAFSGGTGALRCWSLFLYPPDCATGSGACDYCLTSVTGSITAGDLSQTNRISRNNIVASCGSPKNYPGSVTGSLHYDVYAFTNTSTSDACVTALLTSGCDVQAGIYLNAFNPLDITTNYLGDSGTSTIIGPQSCSVTVPALAKFLVTVNEINSGFGCGSYTLQLSGLPCPPPVLNIQAVPTNRARLFWSSSAGGYLLESETNLVANAWTTVTNEPIVTGGNYNVTNSALNPTNRFYRLKKP